MPSNQSSQAAAPFSSTRAPVFMIEVLPTHERTEVTAVRLNGFEEG